MKRINKFKYLFSYVVNYEGDQYHGTATYQYKKKFLTNGDLNQLLDMIHKTLRKSYGDRALEFQVVICGYQRIN